MGQISFEDASRVMNTYNGDGPSVGFFTLKNDGDEAIVRFMHDNTSSFDIVAVHPVNVDGKYRKVNCIRDARDPLDKCPLCNAGVKIENRFYIHLIQYDKDQQGNIVPSAKIWDRSLQYATQLATMINEYGPLSECVFKIKRNGAAGSMDTTYNIMYANPQVYRPELYPKREDLFEGYKTIGTIVMDKNYDELSTFIATGKFPQIVKNNDTTSQAQAAPNNYATPAPAMGNIPPQAYPDTQFTPVQQTVTGAAPWETTTPINRPVRTY